MNFRLNLKIKKNMFKILPFYIIFLFANSLSCQNWDFKKPDYKKIEININNKNTNLFYNNLLEQYKKADSTMTLEEKRHLYYGYIFQSSYKPYDTSHYSDSLRSLMKKDNHDKIDLKKIIRFGDSILVENPFDLRVINNQLYAHKENQENNLYNLKLTKYRIVFDALMSSGDGTSKQNSFYVIYTSHEYALVNILGLKFGGKQSLTGDYDYLTVSENEFGIEGLYFNVTPCLDHLEKTLKK